MTFEQIWKRLCEKQPALLDDSAKLEFKSENLRTLLRQVYEQGEKQGYAKPRQASDKNPFGSIFGT